MPKGTPIKTKIQIAQELSRQMAHEAKIKRTKVLARMVFPAVEQLKTVYDAETVFNACSGHIKYGLQLTENKVKVKDLEFDLEKGGESDIKHAVKTIIAILEDVPAREAYELLEQMGGKLQPFLASKHINDPMNTVTSKEFIAD